MKIARVSLHPTALMHMCFEFVYFKARFVFDKMIISSIGTKTLTAKTILYVLI